LPRKHDDGSGRGILIGKQSGRLMKSGTIFKADEKSVIVGVPDDIAEYGRIHNDGGTVHPKVTDKMRKFAWFKFKETKDESWKWLALTKKNVLDIKIPKRQFLGNSPELTRRIAVFFLDSFKRSLRNNTTFK
jgi:phage gpG-like protein